MHKARGSSSGRGGSNKPTNPAFSFPIKKEKKSKFGPTRMLDATLITEATLPDAFVIILGIAPHLEQYTVHHPVGVSGLGDDEWVLTPTSEIHFLLGRREDPDKKARQESREAAALSNALKKGSLLQDVGEGVMYPTKVPRHSVLAEARKRRGEGNVDIMLLLSPQYQQLEKAARADLAEGKDVWDSFNPDTFKTLGGPMADKRQEAHPRLRGKSAMQARDWFARTIFGIVEEDDEHVKSFFYVPESEKKPSKTRELTEQEKKLTFGSQGMEPATATTTAATPLIDTMSSSAAASPPQGGNSSSQPGTDSS